MCGVDMSAVVSRCCRVCGEEIHPERLEILPHAQECAKHSSVESVVGFMDYSHKTAPSLVMVSSRDKEGMRRAVNAFKRRR